MGYKLVYFNVRGRAEVCRLLFALSGTEYEDIRFSKEEWPALKSDTPFGQVPYLEVDGVKICQSNAMARLLAKRFGYAATDDIGAAREDMIIDCMEDMKAPLKPIFLATDPELKAKLLKDYNEDKFPDFLSKFEQFITENGSTFFAGDKMSWVDISLANFLTGVSGIGSYTLDIDNNKFPKIAAMKAAVESNPKIAEWMEKRPKTPA